MKLEAKTRLMATTLKGFESFDPKKAFDDFPGTTLWKGGRRTEVNTAYHGCSVNVAKKIAQSFTLKAGTYVTGNLHDAMYWAMVGSDEDHSGAVVFVVDLVNIPLGLGDQRDTLSHAVLKKPAKVYVGYATTNKYAETQLSKL